MSDSPYYWIYVYYVLWAFIALIAGVLEAERFDNDPHTSANFKSKYKVDIHVFLTILRCIPAGILVALTYFSYGIIDAVWTSVYIIGVFPFIHDGAYYQTRKYLSSGKVYPKGWWDFKDSSAIFDLRWRTRTILFLVTLFMTFPSQY